MAKIIFHIDKKGDVKVEVDGVIGESCKDLSKAFTDALGTTVSVNEKPEVYEQIDQMEIYVNEE